MTDREEREEHIKRLEAALACEEKQSSGKCSKQTCDDNCDLLYEQGNWGEWKETLRYAINSLKIDLKYDLLYEETSGQADKANEALEQESNCSEIPTGSTTKNDLAHNLCNSCTNIGCELKSIIAKTTCVFYMPPHLEPDNCGNYVVQEPTIKKDCNTCTHNNETDGRNCYECIKNMYNNYEPITKNYTINDLDDFIEFGKKAFGVELTIKKSDNPDTYEKLFGTAKNDLAVDAVSREAVNELVSSQKLDTFSDEGRKWANIKIDVILRGLKELPPVTPQEQKWIPVSEKLPEIPKIYEECYSEDVLVTIRQRDYPSFPKVRVAYYNRYAISSDGVYLDTEGWVCQPNGPEFPCGDITAWMPLPEPYKAEGSEE